LTDMIKMIVCFFIGMAVGIIGVVALALASANSRQARHFDELKKGKED